MTDGPEPDPPPDPDRGPVEVLWLIKGLGPGGAEHLLVNHAAVRDQHRFRYRAAYLVPAKAHLVPDLEGHGVPVTLLDGPRELDPRWVLRLRRLLTAHPADVVHTHSPYVASVVRVLARTLPADRRPALVYTEHNRWPRHSAATRRFNLATFVLDDAQIAVSDDVRSTIARPLRRNVEVIEHGVDVAAVRALADRRDDMRAQLGFGPDDVVVGTVANFRAEKAYDVWLDAAAAALRVEADRGDSPRLRFVSVGQGPLEATMRARLATLDLGDRVQLLGYRDDATAVMTAFDVFTLASRHEGLPVSLMDALVLGLPVVATDVGGIPEAVTDGVEGRLVPPGDPFALARGYLDLAADPAARRAFGAAAARRGEHFDVRRAVTRIEALYRAVARRSPA